MDAERVVPLLSLSTTDVEPTTSASAEQGSRSGSRHRARTPGKSSKRLERASKVYSSSPQSNTKARKKTRNPGHAGSTSTTSATTQGALGGGRRSESQRSDQNKHRSSNSTIQDSRNGAQPAARHRHTPGRVRRLHPWPGSQQDRHPGPEPSQTDRADKVPAIRRHGYERGSQTRRQLDKASDGDLSGRSVQGGLSASASAETYRAAIRYAELRLHGSATRIQRTFRMAQVRAAAKGVVYRTPIVVLGPVEGRGDMEADCGRRSSSAAVQPERDGLTEVGVEAHSSCGLMPDLPSGCNAVCVADQPALEVSLVQEGWGRGETVGVGGEGMVWVVPKDNGPEVLRQALTGALASELQSAGYSAGEGPATADAAGAQDALQRYIQDAAGADRVQRKSALLSALRRLHPLCGLYTLMETVVQEEGQSVGRALALVRVSVSVSADDGGQGGEGSLQEYLSTARVQVGFVTVSSIGCRCHSSGRNHREREEEDTGGMEAEGMGTGGTEQSVTNQCTCSGGTKFDLGAVGADSGPLSGRPVVTVSLAEAAELVTRHHALKLVAIAARGLQSVLQTLHTEV